MENKELEIVIVEIKKLLDAEEYDKVVKICSDEEYSQNPEIRNFKLLALTRAKRYEEGLEEANKFLSEGYSDYIESKKIKLIELIYGLDAALEECNKEINKDNMVIDHRKARILFNMNRFDEALEICNKEEYKNSRDHYKAKFDELRTRTEEFKRKYNCPEALLLTKISIGKIDLNEIRSANIERWEKELLFVAYYEKMFNIKVAFQHAKQLRKTIDEDVSNGKLDEKEKIIKYQMMHIVYDKFLERRYRPFGIGFYEEQLNCKVNPIYAEEVKNAKKAKKEEPKKVEVKEEPKVEVKEEKKEKPQKTIISSVGTIVNNRYNNANNSNTNNIVNTNRQNMTIKEYYRTEVFTIGKYLYACMYDTTIREKAVKAYDNLEAMTEKSAYDTKALEKFVNFLRRIHSELDINMEVVEDKYEKIKK